ncbi:uncharacterized protein DUF3971 [Mesorhizobium sp. J18]|uniref:YhdP family protein n=1 Tax=Mesorhizobium sp. J18 TaxID=935263 RepID=UPI00119B9B5C|nr:DUF3971 domain-containing protein [Mesorhizobium sp. J18]TWG95447.1 uncharacterized protein DUF3971 [Mesorhizobium sp. J18]
MNQDAFRHEKVRFRRGDYAALESYPSSCEPIRHVLRRPLRRQVVRWSAHSMGGLIALAIMLAAALYVAGLAGVGSGRLRAEAERAIASLSGLDVNTEFGGTRLTVDRWRFLALEIRDAKVVRTDNGQSLLEAGAIRFGVRVGPLLTGHVQLGSATISDARIAAADLRPSGGHEWNAAIKNDAGLIEPDMVNDAVFGAIHRAFDLVAAAGTKSLELNNVVLLPPRAGMRELAISRLVVSRERSGHILFEGNAAFGERAFAIEGSATRSSDGERIEALTAVLDVPWIETSEDITTNALHPAGNPLTGIGSMKLSVTGSQSGKEGAALTVVFDVDDAHLGLGSPDSMSGSADIRASLVSGTRAIVIETGRISTGRSSFNFRGIIGPDTQPQSSNEPTYHFRLESGGSTVAPLDSPEAALPVLARIAGRYEPEARRLTADLIAIRTPNGEAMASAAATFEKGKSPGLSLALSVARMPTSEVKQLWPWFAAHGARKWVLDNVFGGHVVDSSLRLRVPPGRLGNGVPLSDEEVSGRFELMDTRFDVAGRIPPVRDSNGTVRFGGTNVDIAISSGAVFMPSGRSVSATEGSFAIRDIHILPRIGKLDIKVKGEAPAVLELASYEPINASRFIDFKPEDLSGKVSGQVVADIPLQADIPTDKLDWRVALDYEGLAIAKPIGGQMVTAAKGNLLVKPQSANIQAEARLNDVPARIDIIEPLGGSPLSRKRDVELQLDNQSRDKLVPGLSSMLSGPATVTFDAVRQDQQKVSVDLTRTTLSLPWVGWRKGGGIPAKATFLMERDEAGIHLRDFRLSGETFSAAGTINLTSGSLSSARFDQVKLNRADDFRVDIDRSGGGYAITVRGASLDARSLVKRTLSESGGGQGGGGSAETASVKLDAELETVTGFHGEKLSGVKLSYSSQGSSPGSMNISANSSSGARITASDMMEDGRRTIRMQSVDAGAALRFLDIYPHMQGGQIGLTLAGSGGKLSGQADARNFWIVNEPRLGSLVAATPAEGRRGQDGQVDGSRVFFERGFAVIEKQPGHLKLDRGVLRGPSIGTTFQGTLYDTEGNMAMTGTFMPAYGVNRIFGEIPLIGQILGNGRDRGLIGVTYRLTGKAAEPQLEVNPISAIAPGIFRQIFEYR